MLPPPTLDEQLTLLDQTMESCRRSLTPPEGKPTNRERESQVNRDLECFAAMRRVLLWAKYHPAFVSMGNHLTAAERAELKGLESACLQSESPDHALVQALHDREKELEVYDEAAFSPRWQD